MKAKGKLPEKPLVTQEILIGPDFCGPRPPTVPEFLSKIDEEGGIIYDYNRIVCGLDLLYEAAMAGDPAASEELLRLSLRVAELGDRFAMPKQKAKAVRA